MFKPKTLDHALGTSSQLGEKLSQEEEEAWARSLKRHFDEFSQADAEDAEVQKAWQALVDAEQF